MKTQNKELQQHLTETKKTLFGLRKFDRRLKMWRGVTFEQYKEIENKRYERFKRSDIYERSTNKYRTLKEIITGSHLYKNTNYHKILIEGYSYIYLAHPSYKHRDYNKSRIMENTEQNRKLMVLVNNIINK